MQGEFVSDWSKTLGDLYRAAADVTEETICSALLAATPLVGWDGRRVPPCSIPERSRACV